jgi:hypothetical protein
MMAAPDQWLRGVPHGQRQNPQRMTAPRLRGPPGYEKKEFIGGIVFAWFVQRSDVFYAWSIRQS